ncbi:MAG: hypothetical protein U0Q18_25520 [Bryobacteraceae bacterium]
MPDSCHFCGEPAEYGCGWPVEAGREATFEALRPGMRWMPFAGAQAYEVVSIEPKPAEAEVWIFIRYRDRRMRHVLVPWRKVLIAEPALCGHPCCVRHVRELAESKFVCQGHWNAWEAAA